MGVEEFIEATIGSGSMYFRTSLVTLVGETMT